MTARENLLFTSGAFPTWLLVKIAPGDNFQEAIIEALRTPFCFQTMLSVHNCSRLQGSLLLISDVSVYILTILNLYVT